MPTSLLRSLLDGRELAFEMAVRDLKALNKGSLLGLLWVVINPLLQVTAYVVIVSFVFRQRALGDGGPFDYAVYVLSGMVPWQVVTKALADAPNLIRDRMELVKQVIYPIETLPLTTLIVSSFGSLVSFAVYLLLALATGHGSWTMVLLPVPLALLAAFLVGAAWLLSIVGVLVKDLREIVSVVLALMVYVSPVVATRELVSPRVWSIIMLNPLAHVVVCFRDVLTGAFHPWSWAAFATMAVASVMLGGWVMRRTKLLINEYI